MLYSKLHINMKNLKTVRYTETANDPKHTGSTSEELIRGWYIWKDPTCLGIFEMWIPSSGITCAVIQCNLRVYKKWKHTKKQGTKILGICSLVGIQELVEELGNECS